MPGNGSGRPFTVGFGNTLQKYFISLLCFRIVVEFLHDAGVHLLHPFIFFHLVQGELADGALMGHFVEEFEAVGIVFNPRINLFIGAWIFTVFNWRV